jgi:prepilin signal peptidase PulO-like enzyme (type II secretory pathway)
MINNNLLYCLSTVTLISLFLTHQIRSLINKNYTKWVDVLFLAGSLGTTILFENLDVWFALLLFWSLFTLSLLDIFYRILPNMLNFLLLSVGLILAIKNQFISIIHATLGVLVGYVVLWGISSVCAYIFGRQGIGGGDLKLTSALGAWIGIEEIPHLLLVASVLGCFFYCIMVYHGKYDRSSKIPLGVFLSIAGMGIFTLRFSSWYSLLG